MIPQRVVLLGFMASGKTQVGSRLATRLGWRHVDLDREIELAAARSIEEIFATEGEPAFRALEVTLTRKFIDLEQVVISPGGGWVTNPRLMRNLPAATLTVWLRVSPEVVLQRLRGSSGQPVRPLLRSDSPPARVAEILAVREPLYRQAMLTVETDDHTVDQVVDLLEKHIRSGEPASTPLDPGMGYGSQ